MGSWAREDDGGFGVGLDTSAVAATTTREGELVSRGPVVRVHCVRAGVCVSPFLSFPISPSRPITAFPRGSDFAFRQARSTDGGVMFSHDLSSELS